MLLNAIYVNNYRYINIEILKNYKENLNSSQFQYLNLKTLLVERSARRKFRIQAFHKYRKQLLDESTKLFSEVATCSGSLRLYKNSRVEIQRNFTALFDFNNQYLVLFCSIYTFESNTLFVFTFQSKSQISWIEKTKRFYVLRVVFSDSFSVNNLSGSLIAVIRCLVLP